MSFIGVRILGSSFNYDTTFALLSLFPILSDAEQMVKKSDSGNVFVAAIVQGM